MFFSGSVSIRIGEATKRFGAGLAATIDGSSNASSDVQSEFRRSDTWYASLPCSRVVTTIVEHRRAGWPLFTATHHSTEHVQASLLGIMRVAETAQQDARLFHRSSGLGSGPSDGAHIRAGCLTDPPGFARSDLALRDKLSCNSSTKCFRPEIHRVAAFKPAHPVYRVDAAEVLQAPSPRSEHAILPPHMPLQECKMVSRQPSSHQHACMPRKVPQPRSSFINAFIPAQRREERCQCNMHTDTMATMDDDRHVCTPNAGDGRTAMCTPLEAHAIPKRLRTRRVPSVLSEAVFASDAMYSIMQHGTCSDIAAMRLTCRCWRHSISMRVRKLAPRTKPLGPHPLSVFPGVLALDLTAIGPQRMRTLSPLLASHLHQLTKLALGDKQGRASWMSNRDLARLGNMTCLRSLALLHPKSVNAQGFSCLTLLTRLEELTMLNCKCIADSLPVICSAWPRLTRLAMMDCKGSIGNTGSIHMVAPHNLGHLHMSKASLAVLGLGDLAQFAQLRNLVIEDTACPLLTLPQGLPRLSLLTGLTCLSLRNVSVQFRTVHESLLGLTCLSSLTLSSTGCVPVPCQGLEKTLGHLCQLRSLDLTGLAVSWTVLFANVGLTSLAMTIPSMPHHCFTVEHQARMPLKRLKLLAVCSSRPLPACLGELAALTYLSLSPIKRVDRCGGQCRLFTSLRMLLPQLSRLQHLDMSLHTDAESVWSIRRRTPGLVVRCHTGLTELSPHCNTVSAV